MTGLTDLGGSALRSVMERIGRGVSRVQERRPLSYDLLESDDAYLVVFDAPGVEREDVQVRFVDGEVQVRMDRFREFHEGAEMRFPGRGLSLSGRASLPGDAAVDPATAEATLTANGTLQVTIPKSTDATDVPVGDEEPAEGDRAALASDEADDETTDATTATDETDDAPAESSDDADGETSAQGTALGDA